MPQAFLKQLQILQKERPDLFYLEHQEFIHRKDQAPMCYVPSGIYIIGAPEHHLFAKESEKPQLFVNLTGFLIDKYPVQVKQYREFMEQNGYQNLSYWSVESRDFLEKNIEAPLMWDERLFNRDTFPVAGVSYYEAEAYSLWAGKRLPSEAQWEAAARGYTGKNKDREFPWGNAFPGASFLNFDENIGHVSAVSSYPKGRSPFGLYDMAGNVNNWCRDWFLGQYHVYVEPYTINPEIDDRVRNEIEAETSFYLNKKSDRGGGFLTSLQNWPLLACHSRLSWNPNERHAWHGFRCVWEIPSDLLKIVEKV
jgi:formylglycine-generating enzyme required for sulfatase activity